MNPSRLAAGVYGSMTAMATATNTPISKRRFHQMALMLILRDSFWHPSHILAEANIRPGFRVLDYGCGVGSFTLAAARLVGPEGKVYAVDIHPMALGKVQRAAAKRGFTNIEMIQSDCVTKLESSTIDVILLYYILHWLSDPDCVLREMNRILKPDGLLSFRDPYMKEGEIISAMTDRGWFRLAGKGEKTYRFSTGREDEDANHQERVSFSVPMKGGFKLT